MMKIINFIAGKIKRRILNIALLVIRSHVSSQDNIFVYVYKKSQNELTPITWKARGITSSSIQKKELTNDWGNLESLVNYNDKIVIDVGASLGITAVHFSNNASMVYAIEPNKTNYNFLLDQVKIRNINNIKTFQIAASDFCGKADFYNRESHGIHSLGAHNKGEILSSSKVNVCTLDEFWENEINDRIGLLKIDVEGFEADVLRGASYLLKNKLIDFVLFELSPRIHSLRKIDTLLPVMLLNNYGYKVITLSGKAFDVNAEKQPKLCDLVAMPETYNLK